MNTFELTTVDTRDYRVNNYKDSYTESVDADKTSLASCLTTFSLIFTHPQGTVGDGPAPSIPGSPSNTNRMRSTIVRDRITIRQSISKYPDVSGNTT